MMHGQKNIKKKYLKLFFDMKSVEIIM